MKIVSDKKLKEIKIYKPSIFKDKRGEIWTKWEKTHFHVQIDFHRERN